MDQNHVVAIVDLCAMTTAKPVIFGFVGTASRLGQPLAP